MSNKSPFDATFSINVSDRHRRLPTLLSANRLSFSHVVLLSRIYLRRSVSHYLKARNVNCHHACMLSVFVVITRHDAVSESFIQLTRRLSINHLDAVYYTVLNLLFSDIVKRFLSPV